MNSNDLAIFDNSQMYFSTERVLTLKYFCRTEGKLVFRSDLCVISGFLESR
jgi:hypothetical protein